MILAGRHQKSWPGGLASWIQPKEYKLVGATLAAIRERAGVTQQQLAKALRLNPLCLTMLSGL
jgi:hypothetical protein